LLINPSFFPILGVDALIDMKLEKDKNLREESRFYWKEIADGTFKFDRKEAEVRILNVAKIPSGKFLFGCNYCSCWYVIMTGCSVAEANTTGAD